MVQIVIQPASNETNNEIVLIELQGALESTAESVTGLMIGDLQFDQSVFSNKEYLCQREHQFSSLDNINLLAA